MRWPWATKGDLKLLRKRIGETERDMIRISEIENETDRALSGRIAALEAAERRRGKQKRPKGNPRR